MRDVEEGVSSEERQEILDKNKRSMFKKAVVVGGMSMAVTEWSKPVVNTVILPAHASMSVLTLTAGFDVD